DRSVESYVHEAEKADTSKPGHVPAPFSGTVTVSIDEGTTVEAGDTVATIEAMKMEAGITAPVAGTVSRVVLTAPTPVEGSDLILVIDPAERRKSSTIRLPGSELLHCWHEHREIRFGHYRFRIR